MNYSHDIGITLDDRLKEDKRFRILRLLNFFFILSFLGVNLIYIIVDLRLFLPIIISNSLSVISLLFSLYYNKNERYLTAGIIFGYTITFSLLVLSIFTGGTPEFHQYFFLYAIITLVAIPVKHKFHLISVISLNLLFFVYIEYFYSPSHVIVDFPKEHLSKIEGSTLYLIFQTTVVLLIYYKSITEKYESLFKKYAQKLGDSNRKLETQSRSLGELNTLLEERQQQIEEQSEELKAQKEELQNANERLKELVATKDRFFSIIAHDLKNPINGIMGFSSLLEEKMDTLTADKRQLYIKNISDSVKKTYSLLEDLLEWARSQNSHIKLKAEKVDIKSIIELNDKLFREIAGTKNIKLTLDIEDTVIIALCDRNMIDTVIRNLVSNAIKFTPPGGYICVKAAIADGKFMKISVSDTGVGITKEQRINLFRIDKSSSTSGTHGETGTGLGLILCKEFVEKNGGKLYLESETEKGSIVSFTLPAVEY